MNPNRNASGKHFTKALFFEMATTEGTAVYTLKDHDHGAFRSLYLLYLDVSDPTEYRFARQHLDGWRHWQVLQECTWLKPYIERWRAELAVKIQSESIQKIREIASATGRDALSACKTLLELSNKRARVGRPNKETHPEPAIEALEARLVAEDLNRLQKDLN
jgi:hypothetical protein